MLIFFVFLVPLPGWVQFCEMNILNFGSQLKQHTHSLTKSQWLESLGPNLAVSYLFSSLVGFSWIYSEG